MAAPTLFLSAEASAEGNYTTTYAPLKTTQKEGRKRVSTFTVTLAAQAVGTYGLCKVPAGARITDIKWRSSVGLGGTATIAIGLAGADNSGYYEGTTADDGAYFRAAATSNVTTEVDGDTTTGSILYTTTKEVWITATVAAAALPGSGTWGGVVEYVVD